ncbi:PpiC-type peptidyl-prolyl cis-trans isomerase [Psychromonas sp. CNPT3]|uniref:SurA N-terminal domain-containing protein n=1 Tax=Psychromonas sp. CNPT3 TaxID=314282 RepID=UPI00006E767F|nr:SurA N-terminal domain-containing protein [Psychromonas sp. CNPT3]AGH81671.1 PpiC-type peptidyl-prolyl cis-trans isomerase [Psychromonas sp. CNPT3]
MLDKMREGSQGIAAKIILIVIILSFALAGVSGYLGGGNASVAITVNGDEISNASVEQEYKNERSRLQQQYGEQFDIIAASPGFVKQVRAQAKQTLISNLLIAQSIADMDLRIGDEQVKDAIRKMPEFQVKGEFNNEQYLSTLRRASYTPAKFSQSIKQDLVRRQLLNTLVSSEFILPIEIDNVDKLQAQQRVARILNISGRAFPQTTPISIKDIQAYYDQHEQNFQSLQQVSVDYVLLDAHKLSQKTVISDVQAQAYYDDHQVDYQRVERRKVAHILVQGHSADALKKAQTILLALEKGADFSVLARAKSEDILSAKNDGALDWFEHGVMDEQFDKASFALTAKAPLSDIVKSTFGYHIIKLLDIQQKQTLPFAQVKATVMKTLKKENADERYYDLQQQLREVAFEAPDSLDEAAGVVNTQIQHIALFSRDNVPALLDDPALLNLLFDIDFREEGLNSDVFELSDKRSIVVRVSNFKEAATESLDKVSDTIKSQLSEQNSRAKAHDFTLQVLEKLNKGESVEALLQDKSLQFSKALTLSRYSREVNPQVVQKVFTLAKPQADKVTRDWVSTNDTGDTGFAIIELSKVLDTKSATTMPALKEQLGAMLVRGGSEATYQAWIMQLMQNADIKHTLEK